MQNLAIHARNSPRAGYDGAKRKRDSKLHLAVDTLGHLLALHVTPASVDDRAAVARLAEVVQEATDDSLTFVYADQGYTGEKASSAARDQGIHLQVVKLPEAKRGFVILLKPCVVERSFAWSTRCRRLVKDYERYAETLAGLHVAAFACIMIAKAVSIMVSAHRPLALMVDKSYFDLIAELSRQKQPRECI